MSNLNNIESSWSWEYNQLVISDTYWKTLKENQEEIWEVIQENKPKDKNFSNEKSLAKTVEKRWKSLWIPPVDLD